MFEKSTTRCKNTDNIATVNIKILNTVNHLPKLTAYADEHNIDIICIQKHKFYHRELEIKYHDTVNEWIFVLASAWKNSINAVIGGVGILLWPCILRSHNGTERILMRMMCASINGNLCTIIVSCYSPANSRDKTNMIIFYNKLSSFIQHILKHNILIIGWDMNAHMGKERKDKFSWYNSKHKQGISNRLFPQE